MSECSWVFHLSAVWLLKKMCTFTLSMHESTSVCKKKDVVSSSFVCQCRVHFACQSKRKTSKMARFYLFALGILSCRGLIYMLGLHSSSTYEAPAEWNNSLDAPCEVGPHISTIRIMHKWRMGVLEFPVLGGFFSSCRYGCLPGESGTLLRYPGETTAQWLREVSKR